MADTVLEHAVPSEEKIERFLRGEDSLDFRSTFGIDTSDARYVERQVGDEEVTKQFLAVRGVATTAKEDDNGVEVVPDALKSMPNDFSRRTTVLFNHNVDMPIGRLVPGESAKFVGGRNARVEVDPVLIDVDVRLQTGQRIVDAIERGTLNRFSFAWSTRDGIVVFGPNFFAGATDDEVEDLGLDPDEVFSSFRIGIENAPFVRVFSLTAVELSVVSVPADAGAGFGMASFSRNLEAALSRYSRDQGGQVLVPENYRQDASGRIAIPVAGGRIGPQAFDYDERTGTVSDQTIDMGSLRSVVAEIVEDVLDARDSVTLANRGNVPFQETPAIDRPWDAGAAINRVEEWAKGNDDELDLENEDHFDRFMQAFTHYTGDGTAKADFALPHHDFVDGELVSNFRGVVAAARRFNQTSFEGDAEKDEARNHLFREYTETHDVDPEEVPEVLKESIDDSQDDVRGGDTGT